MDSLFKESNRVERENANETHTSDGDSFHVKKKLKTEHIQEVGDSAPIQESTVSHSEKESQEFTQLSSPLPILTETSIKEEGSPRQTQSFGTQNNLPEGAPSAPQSGQIDPHPSKFRLEVEDPQGNVLLPKEDSDFPHSPSSWSSHRSPDSSPNGPQINFLSANAETRRELTPRYTPSPVGSRNSSPTPPIDPRRAMIEGQHQQLQHQQQQTQHQQAQQQRHFQTQTEESQQAAAQRFPTFAMQNSGIPTLEPSFRNAQHLGPVNQALPTMPQFLAAGPMMGQAQGSLPFMLPSMSSLYNPLDQKKFAGNPMAAAAMTQAQSQMFMGPAMTFPYGMQIPPQGNMFPNPGYVPPNFFYRGPMPGQEAYFKGDASFKMFPTVTRTDNSNFFTLMEEPHVLQRKSYKSENRRMKPNPLIVCLRELTPEEKKIRILGGRVFVTIVDKKGEVLPQNKRDLLKCVKGSLDQTLNEHLAASFCLKILETSEGSTFRLLFTITYNVEGQPMPIEEKVLSRPFAVFSNKHNGASRQRIIEEILSEQ
eukprot:TRINITY_DN10846_c0_g1_i1.p1 TRINITY_DN10846_c0_g1~~TRINITY_DN10846_c0_g1_i1.p1  ORF type:complete len:537 (-),score=102.89 TRINITY_DN10846_c0_g1_i1:205-1815(-)